MASEQEKARSLPGYEIVEMLGQGGFGVVYRARQLAVDREVALKIDTRVLATDRDRRRFMREVTAAGRLSGHPHVVAVYDAGLFDDGRPYMVLELCPNGSLADRVRADGPLPAAEVREIGMNIAAALAAAHDIGVLHRDVKPANILINQYGSVALADFGLATMPSPGLESSATREALTPAYAPPEAFRLEAPTPAGDVYALGATLYALLQGRPPRFPEGGSPSIASLMALHRQPVPDLPGVPPALTDVLRRSLAYDPADRPEDAGVLRDLLAAVDLARPADRPADRSSALPSALPSGPQSGPLSGGPAQGWNPAGAPGFIPGPVPATPVGWGPQGPAAPVAWGPQGPGPAPATAPAGWGPQGSVAGPMTVPPLGHPTSPAGQRPARGPSRALAGVAAAVVVTAGIAGGGAVIASQWGGTGTPRTGATARTPAAGAGAGATERGTPQNNPAGGTSASAAPEQGTLLSPAGVRKVADALRALAGSNKVVELIVYTDYAKAEFPAKAGPGTYDNYEYRDGRATRVGPGGTYDTATRLPDLSKIDWNVLPRLYARANGGLGIKKPTLRYMIVDGGLIPAAPTIRVYLYDGYRTGYLNADLHGRIRRLYRAGS